MLRGKVETRVWPTQYRGEVLICTSLKPYACTFLNNPVFDISGSKQVDRLVKALENDTNKNLYGYAIAVGKLVECRPMTITDEDACFVEYKEPWYVKDKHGNKKLKKLYCHVYENVQPIQPFAYTGHLSFKTVPAGVISSIVYL